MPRKDPSGYVWLAATLRMEIERLAECSQRADELELPKLSAKLGDAAIELAKVYEKLIQLASPAPAGQKPARMDYDAPELPF